MSAGTATERGKPMIDGIIIGLTALLCVGTGFIVFVLAEMAFDRWRTRK